MKRIMVIDDERNMCEALRILLEGRGYSVTTSSDGRHAIQRVTEGEAVDLVITDLKMPGKDGMDVLTSLRETRRSIPVILITAYGTIDSAVEAMKIGATDFITKPFDKEELCNIVDKALNREFETDQVCAGVVYESRAMREILDTAAQIADAPTPVLLTGESGTGKGLIAECIHKLGTGSHRPFVPISCPAIPESLLESELFGYRKGAFTGADTDFRGRVRTSEGGTLFMDEIAEIPLGLQSKLLRLLEEKQFQPLGSTETVSVHNRIICATNRDLPQLVEDGEFRTDLFYRINTINLKIPPLRDRPEDILPMAEHFLACSADTMNKHLSGFGEQAKHALRRYDWPGNARELRNAIERAVVLSRSHELQLSDLPEEVREAVDSCAAAVSNAGSTSVPGYHSGDGSGSGTVEGYAVRSGTENKLATAERDVLEEAMRKHEGNVTAAAKALGVSRGTLRYRMKKHGMSGG